MKDKVRDRLAEKDDVMKKGLSGVIPGMKINGKEVTRELIKELEISAKPKEKIKEVKETVKEKIKREKDPIIFGKIQESDKYYFIGDWEDELDNLRLGDIVEELSIDKKSMGIKQHIDMKKAKDKMLKGGEK